MEQKTNDSSKNVLYFDPDTWLLLGELRRGTDFLRSRNDNGKFQKRIELDNKIWRSLVQKGYLQ